MDRSKFLQVGDVFRLAPGMRVDYEHFENRFSKDYSPFDTEAKKSYICIDKVYTSSRNIELVRGRLFTFIQSEFKRAKVVLDDDLLRRYLNHVVILPEEKTFCIPSGMYIVTEIQQEPPGQVVKARSHNTLPVYSIQFHQGNRGMTNLSEEQVRPVNRRV